MDTGRLPAELVAPGAVLRLGRHARSAGLAQPRESPPGPAAAAQARPAVVRRRGRGGAARGRERRVVEARRGIPLRARSRRQRRRRRRAEVQSRLGGGRHAHHHRRGRAGERSADAGAQSVAVDGVPRQRQDLQRARHRRAGQPGTADRVQSPRGVGLDGAGRRPGRLVPAGNRSDASQRISLGRSMAEDGDPHRADPGEGRRGGGADRARNAPGPGGVGVLFPSARRPGSGAEARAALRNESRHHPGGVRHAAGEERRGVCRRRSAAGGFPRRTAFMATRTGTSVSRRWGRSRCGPGLRRSPTAIWRCRAPAMPTTGRASCRRTCCRRSWIPRRVCSGAPTIGPSARSTASRSASAPARWATRSAPGGCASC